MKKSKSISIVFFSVFFITSLIIIPVTIQSAQKDCNGSKPISDDVMKIAKKSCVHCHTEPGNKMALAHLNLSNWDKFSPDKQADKAKAMCKMVSKGKMPPKNFREKHPDGVPSKAEIKTICDWAQ